MKYTFNPLPEPKLAVERIDIPKGKMSEEMLALKGNLGKYIEWENGDGDPTELMYFKIVGIFSESFGLMYITDGICPFTNDKRIVRIVDKPED